MAATTSSSMSFFVSFSLCLLLLSHGTATLQEQEQGQQRQFRQQSQCRVENLRALEPNRRIESEAGVTEHWDENNEEFECAGVAATRYIIQPRGLLLPEFSNAPRLVYIEQGRGFSGAVIPGCPESFHSFRQSQQSEQEQGRQRYRDQHQKIHHFRQGDIIAFPAGMAHWCYNDGETPVVAVAVFDTSNQANQLDQNLRRFQLAGSQQYEPQSMQQQEEEQQRRVGRPYTRPAYQQESGNENIFSGFNVETLAEAFGVSTETARKLQSEDDRRGNIVRVENGLQVVRPPRREEDEQREQRGLNGLEETTCSMRLTENIADPTRADVYTPRGGRIRNTNGQNLPILRTLQMSAERGVLYRNALLAPHWNLNAHSVVYVTRGNGRIQIVGDNGRSVFDGDVRQGQLVIVPQMFAVLKQAGNEGFEYVAFKTNDNAISNPLVGKASAFRAMPEDVLMNAYRISREEARRLKYNRGEETKVFEPSYQRSEGGKASA
ncbi:cocosin 1-like [Magnolia sinica]|uniref:cocosin 1-like n=1 Tax=Magnolia sinica TaxID=86752 RepID=UPI00265A9AD8|nr:cocosin 1-like [Magnolia sinica]